MKVNSVIWLTYYINTFTNPLTRGEVHNVAYHNSLCLMVDITDQALSSGLLIPGVVRKGDYNCIPGSTPTNQPALAYELNYWIVSP